MNGHDVLVGGTGKDLLVGDAGDDLLIGGIALFDPVGAPPPGDDNSTSAGDTNDAALLADWVLNRPALLGLLTTLDDGFLDHLTGGTGNDRAPAPPPRHRRLGRNPVRARTGEHPRKGLLPYCR